MTICTNKCLLGAAHTCPDLLCHGTPMVKLVTDRVRTSSGVRGARGSVRVPLYHHASIFIKGRIYSSASA